MVDGLNSKKLTRLFYSDQLKCCLEYLFDDLSIQAEMVEDNYGEILSQEVFEIINKVGVKMIETDAVMLKRWLNEHTKHTNQRLKKEDLWE